jgi:protocatechuate 3,4-dioxygenase beta subunit
MPIGTFWRVRRLYTRMGPKPVWAMFALAQFVLAQDGTASLSGRVVNSVTKAGIPGVELSFCRMHPRSVDSGGLITVCDPAPGSGVTDDTGSFHAAGIAEGRYLVTPAPMEGFGPPIAPPPFTISGDTRRDLELTPLAAVHGRVLDPEGNPAEGVVVRLLGLDFAGCYSCNTKAVKTTDAIGEFVLTDVPPGDSMILTASKKVQDTQAEEKIVITYYPSAIDRDLAQRIHIEGTDVFGYDIKLRSVPAHGIRGIVLDAAGNPVPKALVSIVKPVTGMVAAVRGEVGFPPFGTPLAEPVETAADGTFQFPPVMRGNWMLRVAGNARGWPDQAGSAEVTVADAEVEGAIVRIAPAFDIELKTNFGDSPPAKIPTILVTMIPQDSPQVLLPLPGDLPPGETPRIKLFAGKYLVAPAQVLEGYYLAAALLGNRDVLGQVTDVARGDTVQLVFRKDGGSVRGTVEPGGEARVVLMADPGASGRLGYSALSDASGAFTIADVPPGEYTALAGLPLPDFASAEFATMLKASGKRVHVEAGATAQVELRLAGQ